MQLCCVIDSNSNKAFVTTKQLIVCLMVFLFAGAPVLEALHAHDHPCHISTHEGHSLYEAQIKCKICEHLTNHQPVVSMTVHSFELACPELKLTMVRSHYADLLLQLSGFCFTNKGPPSLV